MKRKQFGVPFSGIEIIQYPFLKQFAKLNMDLHSEYKRDEEKASQSKLHEEVNTEFQRIQALRDQMQNDDSVFVYKTISNKSPKKIGKGLKIKQIHQSIEEEFIKRGMGAVKDFKRIYDQVESEQAKEKLQEEELEQKSLKEEPQKSDKNVPEIKLKKGDDFIDMEESIEYLRKVKFLNFKRKREEGKTDEQIRDELDDDRGLDKEERILKSILKKAVAPEEGPVEPNGRRGRTVKASELVQEKRKQKDQQFISHNFAMRSGIEVPETQEVAKRRKEKEDQEAREAPWKALMEAEGEDEDKLRDIGGYIPFKDFQEYSRENLVIYKRLSGYMSRWIVSAGKVFDKQGFYFIPIKIIGSPMNQRSTIVQSVVYLELMKFPRSAIQGKEFETIWPFLLYLLNNLIRHQFSVIGVTNEKALEEKIVERKEKKAKEEEKKTTDDENMEALKKRNKLKNMTPDERRELEKLGTEEKEMRRYEEILNFSSEIEYDDAYDIFEDTKTKKKEEKKIDENLEKKEVYPDIKQNNSKTVDVTFQQFLVEHTVKLPNTQTNRFKLLKNMQAKSYFELNSTPLERNTIVLLNEERRRYKKLPPLTPLDYNCIDKAATKLKTVLDTLSIIRKINGKALVKRHLKNYFLAEEREKYVSRKMQMVVRRGSLFSPELVMKWKAAIVYPEGFNRNQVMVGKSLGVVEENEEIEEVDEDQEHSETKLEKSIQEVKEITPIIMEERISKHTGSVEEFIGDRTLFEQGQARVEDYVFFSNVYFRRFKLDHIQNEREFSKILEFDVISKNDKLYEGKNFPKDYIQQLERAKKDLTDYISFCEIELLSRSSLSHWGDSVAISWERLKRFFSMFNLRFDPIQFIRSERFSNQERYIFFTYFPSAIKIENSSAEVDLSMIDTRSIFDYLCMNKDSYGYAFFKYNNIFPEDYEYEDMEYEPYSDQIPTFLEAVELENSPHSQRAKPKQMNLAFNLEEEEKEKYNVKIPGEVEDPISKLSLKKMAPATGVFLGRLKLGEDNDDFYNLKIDFYKQGYRPILEIKL